MPVPFRTWDLNKIKEVLGDLVSEAAGTNRPYVEGDHWQDGEAWIGPRPDVADSDAAEVLELIRQSFVSSNAVLEVISRHANGVIGHEPSWGFTPNRPMKADERPEESEQTTIDLVEAALTEWWDERGVHNAMLRAMSNMLWGERALIRAYIPAGRLALIGGTGEIPKPSETASENPLAEALKHIYVEAPEPEAGAVYFDPLTMYPVAITRFELEDESGNAQENFELVFVDDVTGMTVFRTVGPSGDSIVEVEMGGHMPVHGGERSLLITPSILQNQRALNLALTLAPKNLADSAFLERTFLNARMPGHMEETRDSSGRTTRTWVPESFRTGAGAVNFVSGIEIPKPDGTVGLTEPRLMYQQMVDVSPVFKARTEHHASILQEAKQSYILMNEDGRASGISREQARTDYNVSLTESKNQIDRMGRNFLMGVLALAEVVAKQVGAYTLTLRPYFEARLDLGPVSQAERSQNSLDVNSGLMSAETAMVRSGIVDVDKELAIIASGSEAKLSQLERFAEIASKFSGTGVRPSTIATILNMDATIISALTTAESAEDARLKAKAEADAQAKAKTAAGAVEPSPTE